MNKSTWPQETGWWWIWGRMYDLEMLDYHPVKVIQASNGFVYICEGVFLWKNEHPYNNEWLWFKAELPAIYAHSLV